MLNPVFQLTEYCPRVSFCKENKHKVKNPQNFLLKKVTAPAASQLQPRCKLSLFQRIPTCARGLGEARNVGQSTGNASLGNYTSQRQTTTNKTGLKFCSGKGIHQEDTSPGAVFLSKLKLELKNVISTHTKAPAFLLGRKKTKKRLRQRSPESPPSLALKITCILPLGSPNHDQGGRH